MKKAIIIAVAVVLCAVLIFFLIPSIPGTYSFTHSVDTWEDVKIEIVQINDPVCGTYYTTGSFDTAYNVEKITVIAEVTKNAVFIQELQKVRSYRPWGDPFSEIAGEAIRLTYPDGEIELITACGSALISDSQVSIRTITFNAEQFHDLFEAWS